MDCFQVFCFNGLWLFLFPYPNIIRSGIKWITDGPFALAFKPCSAVSSEETLHSALTSWIQSLCISANIQLTFTRKEREFKLSFMLSYYSM